MLRIIYGNAGTGSSVPFYDEIAKSAEMKRKTVLFVPDQFSFEAEKIIYRKVPRNLSRYVTVTTFSREAQKILHLFGKTKEYADDITKNILMMCAVRQTVSDGSLEYYSRQVSSLKFPAFMLKVIGELKTAGISPSGLKNLVLNGDFSPSLERKLNDISVIYTAYDEQFTVNKFNDRLDDVLTASELILSGALTEKYSYDGAYCFFDGFDTFSGNQFCFIKALMAKADTVTFSLETEDPNSSKREFSSTSKLIGKLKNAADGECEFIKDETAYKKCSSLRVIQAADPWNESDWICSEIRRLTDGEMRCRDIAVLVPNSAYTQILASALKKYDIPAFVDIPEPLITKSFVRFAIYALRALSFETEDILRYIKSGYVRIRDSSSENKPKARVIRDTEINSIEKLCREHDIRRKDWLNPFPAALKSYDYLEELRKSIIEPLKELQKSLDTDDGGEMTKALCSFICDKMVIDSTIYGKCMKYDNETPLSDENSKREKIIDNRKMDAFSSIWDDVVTVFESAYKSLGGRKISLKEFIDILTSVFTTTTVSKPPQTLDAVTVGDTRRSRLSGVKTVFICGFNHGVMPPPSKVSDAFSGSENEELAKLGVPVTPDRESRFSEEQFLIYRCTNLPEEKLYITYPVVNESSSPAEPANEIESIIKRFGKDTAVEYARDFGAEFYCRTEKSSLKYLAGIYSDFSHTAEKKALLERLSERAEELLCASGEKKDTERHLLSAQNAEKLMKKETYSPSQIERMNKCKFSYFCQYGLGIRDDETRDITASVVGNTVHYCLQRLLQEEGFTDYSDDDIDKKVAEYISDFENENYIENFGSSERFSYKLKSLAETAVKASCRVRDDINSGAFFPEKLESTVSFPFGDVTIEGKCDRYDTAVVGNKKYVRVIDYKHGQKDLKLKDVYNGQNLQMLLYLFGLCKDGELPSSVAYLPYGALRLESAVSAEAETKAEKAASSYMSKNRISRIILGNSPETLTEDEKKKSETIEPDAFDSMKEYCRSYISARVSEVVSGMIGACAYSEDECIRCRKYSRYDVFCGRDEISENDDNEQ